MNLLTRAFRCRSALLVAACSAAFVGGCGRHSNDETKASTSEAEVTVTRVEKGMLSQDLLVSGNLVTLPNQDAKAAALVGGRIERILVTEGDRVSTGQDLVRIESEPLREQVRQAEAAVAQAEVIIENGVQSFVQWLDRRGSIPLIQALHAQADDWRALEIARARKLLAGGEDVGAVLEALSKGLTQKMLHGPLAELRAADGDERARLAETVSRLFLRARTRSPGDDKR